MALENWGNVFSYRSLWLTCQSVYRLSHEMLYMEGEGLSYVYTDNVTSFTRLFIYDVIMTSVHCQSAADLYASASVHVTCVSDTHYPPRQWC